MNRLFVLLLFVLFSAPLLAQSKPADRPGVTWTLNHLTHPNTLLSNQPEQKLMPTETFDKRSTFASSKR